MVELGYNTGVINHTNSRGMLSHHHGLDTRKDKFLMLPHITPILPASLYNVSGIYVIRNTVNGKVYVGSAVSLGERRKTHFGKLRRQQHPSRHLQSAYNRYGPDAFVFEVVESVEDKTDLIAREQHWIDTCQSYLPRKGYNTRRKAESNLGVSQSEETRRKRSVSLMGNQNGLGVKQTPESIEKRRHHLLNNSWNKGKKNGPHSEETKRKISEALKGNPLIVGRKRSEEFKCKVSEGMRAYKGRVYAGLVSPDGHEYPQIDNLRVFCEKHGLRWPSMVALFSGRIKTSKGWYIKGREPQPRVTSRMLAAMPKQDKAIELRGKGYTFEQIAIELGLKDKSSAHSVYKAGMKRRGIAS